jgi:hypothetical protein
MRKNVKIKPKKACKTMSKGIEPSIFVLDIMPKNSLSMVSTDELIN